MKVYKYLLSFTFASIILCTCILSLRYITADKINPEFDQAIERRQPNLYPSLTLNFDIINTYPKKFESAFNDQFAFRSYLKKFYEHAYFFITRRLYSETFYHERGSDRAFFVNHSSGLNNFDFRYTAIFNELQRGINYEEGYAKLRKEKDIILQNRSFMESFPVPILLAAVLTKPYLEFDKMPLFMRSNFIKEKIQKPPVQRIIDELPHDFVDKYVLFPYKEIVEYGKKLDVPLIPQYSFHWHVSPYTNLIANKIAAKFKIYKEEEPDLSLYDFYKFPSELQDYTSIVAPKNKHYMPTPKLYYGKDVSVYTKFVDIESSKFKLVSSLNTSNTKDVFVFGDSFSLALPLDLSRYFKNSYVISNQDFSPTRENILFIAELVQKISPEYVVFFSHLDLSHDYLHKVNKLYELVLNNAEQRTLAKSPIILKNGWHKDDPLGVWSGALGEIRFRVPRGKKATLMLPYQFFETVTRVAMYVQNKETRIDLPALTESKGVIEIPITEAMKNSFGYITLFFKPNLPISPAHVGSSDDTRTLGIALGYEATLRIEN